MTEAVGVLITTSTFGEEDPAPKRELARLGLAVHENPHRRKLTEGEVTELLARHRPRGMIAGLEPLTARVLEAAGGHLKVISRCGTGMENVDVEAAKRLGMSVFNTPAAPAPAVAELTLGLILAVARRIAEADQALRAGRWERLMGRLLCGKTAGVVGCGRIGARVARLLQAFECEVLGCDALGVSAAGVREVSLDELLARADIVTLHVPLSGGNRRLLDASRIAAMKPGAILVNTARGGLVDEEALAAALKEGRLSGAGLDTFEVEPYDGPLKGLPNAVLTAHMGSAARECRTLMEREAASNLITGLRSLGAI